MTMRLQPGPSSLARAAAAVAFCAVVAGCAGLAGDPRQPAPAPLPPAFSPQLASAAVAPGQTREEVRGRLGQASEIRFDSGYEVWAYRGSRGADAGAGTEFVILFAPSGTVQKTRVRLANGAPAR